VVVVLVRLVVVSVVVTSGTGSGVGRRFWMIDSSSISQSTGRGYTGLTDERTCWGGCAKDGWRTGFSGR
jgi:hypothetical protein